MNNTERFVKRFYKSIGITDSHQLTIENISQKLRIKIIYWNYTSEIINYRNAYKLFLNENLNEQQQWVDFGHELGHYFCDNEDQSCLPKQYVNYQEYKADYFAYHFCVPTFMLLKIKGVDVYDVMNLFNVEFDFALRRLEMYKNKILERKMTYAGTYS